MHRTFRKSESIAERQIAGEHILVPIRSDMEALDSLYTLNETASVVWVAAGEGLDEDAIVDRLTAQFDVDRARAAADTAAVLRELLELGALQDVGHDA